MEEEFEEIEVEYACLEEGEIYFDYEFDAPQFCDFTRPKTFLNVTEADQWFESADNYPPSPFMMKLGWGNSCEMEGKEDKISSTEENKEREENMESNIAIIISNCWSSLWPTEHSTIICIRYNACRSWS